MKVELWNTDNINRHVFHLDLSKLFIRCPQLLTIILIFL